MTSTKRNYFMRSFLVLAIIIAIAISTTAPVFADSVDKTFTFTTTNITDQAFINKAYSKDNTSSIYAYIKYTRNSAVTYAYVNARGGYTSAPTSTWAWCNSAESPNRRMSVGTQYFIYNNVKEANYTYAALSFKSNTPVYMSGVWSPDSVWQSGVVQI